jgi:hypothetical protein
MKQVADWLAVEDWHMLGDGAIFIFFWSADIQRLHSS